MSKDYLKAFINVVKAMLTDENVKNIEFIRNGNIVREIKITLKQL